VSVRVCGAIAQCVLKVDVAMERRFKFAGLTCGNDGTDFYLLIVLLEKFNEV
jgi:hypothetical protein